MELAGKKVLVVGLAQTGISVARFCAARGAEVTVNDGKSADELQEKTRLLDGCAQLALGGHDEDFFTSSDLIVMSPGGPELDATRAARAAGVEVIAEIELAHRFFVPGATLIAITGTNGKSTTTALTGALCAASGRPTFCGGNLGNHPLIEAVDHPANSNGGLIVAEVAGFMLETCTSFRPHIAACLNITPDHLDRYGTFEVYASMKTRIYKWLEASDCAIANAADRRTVEAAEACGAKVYMFDSTMPSTHVREGAFLDCDEICLKLAGEIERYPMSDLSLIGRHNMENAMAAYLAARLGGVHPSAIREGARTFVPQKHRMERVGSKDGVVFFDDSKGTNVAAVAASLRGFPMPVVLIAGGVDKGGSYADMFESMEGVAKGLVLIGEAAPLIRKAAEDSGFAHPVVDASTMNEAVTEAIKLASAGDAVVLSPACSSYDMFRNFGERGMAFRQAIAELGAS
jgi:UDP-N-acetylmuramoylalanine--D-glutamate ligase